MKLKQTILKNLKKGELVAILRRVTGVVGDTARISQYEYRCKVDTLPPHDVAEAMAALGLTEPIKASTKDQVIKSLRADNAELRIKITRLETKITRLEGQIGRRKIQPPSSTRH